MACFYQLCSCGGERKPTKSLESRRLLASQSAVWVFLFLDIYINNFPTHNDTKSQKKGVVLCKMLNITPQFESKEWSEGGKCSHTKSLILWDNATIWKNFYTFLPFNFLSLIFLLCSLLNGKYYEQNWTRVSGILLFNLNFWKIEEYNNAESIWGRLYEKVKREKDFHHHFENTSPFWLDWNELKMTRPNGRNSTTNEMTYLVGLFRYIFWQHVNISR